jgi:hypothetical protein
MLGFAPVNLLYGTTARTDDVLVVRAETGMVEDGAIFAHDATEQALPCE